MRKTQEKNSTAVKTKPALFKSVSGKLIAILVPLIAISTIILIMVLMQNAKSIITTSAKDSLDNEAHYQAESLAADVSPVITNFDGVVSSLNLTQIFCVF